MINKVVITPPAKQIIIQEIQKTSVIETGGILAGYYDDDCIIIASASGPGPDASHSIIEFIADKQYMHEFLDAEYAHSQGKHIYVGEWHTHPQVQPSPSDQDIVSFCERISEWNYGELVFIIIGFTEFTEEKLKEQSITLKIDKNFNIRKMPIIFI